MGELPLAFSVHKFVTSVGADVGFAALIGLALLVLLFFAQARETASLRLHAEELLERVADLESRLGRLGAQAVQGAAPPTRAVAEPGAPAPAPYRRRAGEATVAMAAVGTRSADSTAAELEALELPPAAPAGVGAPALAAATRVVPAGIAVHAVAAQAPGRAGAPGASLPVEAPVGGGVPGGAAVEGGVPVGAPVEGGVPVEAPVEGGLPVGAPVGGAAGSTVVSAPAAAGIASARAATSALGTRAGGEPPLAPATVAGAAFGGDPPRNGAHPPSRSALRGERRSVPRPVGPGAAPGSGARAGSGHGSGGASASARRAPSRAATYAGERNPPDAPARSRGPRILAVVLALLVVAGGAVAAVVLTQSGAGTSSRNSTVATRQSSRERATAPAVNPAAVTVAVLNGTPTVGLASRTALRLVQDGFRKGTVTNAADQTTPATTVAYLPGQHAAALAVARALKLASRSVVPIDSGTRAVACGGSTTCSATVVVTVGANYAQ